MPSATSVIIASLVTAALGVGGVVAVTATSADADTQATVVKVVDGDTIDVRYDGTKHRVRLLNIDTPEVGGEQRDAECLAPEATDFLKRRLPVGATVTLRWDTEHEDRYQRQLRGVFDDAGFVNADIVRNGLAVPMHIEPNHEYRDEVDEAFAEASHAKRGLWDADHQCTLAARTERVNSAVADGKRATAYKEAVALHALIEDPGTFTSRLMTLTERTNAAARLLKVIAQHSTPEKGPRTSSPAPVTTTAPTPSTTTPAPALPSPPRTTTSKPTPQQTTQQPAPPPPSPAPPSTTSHTPPPAPRTTSTPAPSPPAAPQTGNSAPCRSYAPGGKTFTYIDCDTKQPL